MNAVLEAREPSARYLGALQPPLVKHFELIASAPRSVARLRELILTLAVQGKLVPQDTSDQPAAMLLDRIQAEKELLIEAGKIKREKPVTPIRDDEVPHDLPAGWLWVRLATVSKKITDGTHHSPASFATGDFKYLSAKNIKGWGIDLSDVTYVPAAVHQEIYSRCDPEFGDILYIKDGATTGVLTINTLKEQFSLLSSVGVIKPSCGLTSAYLAVVLRSPFFYQAMRDGMTGVAITRVTLAKLAAALLPLPPLPEQNRIVVRVDELMRLCDSLEEKGRLEAGKHHQLLNVVLETLTNSASPEELAVNWQRVSAHFDLLLDRPEAVDFVEQSVLHLATSGRFAPQPSCNEATPSSTDDAATANAPFDLPLGWVWASLGLLSTLVTSGSRSWKDFYAKEGATFIRSQDIKLDRVEFDNRAYVKLLSSAEGVRTRVLPQDLLITITGANVAKAAVLSEPIDEAYVSQHVALVRLLDPRFADYVHLWLVNDRGGRRLLLESSYGAKPGLNLRNIRDLLVPLPPLTEQRRIVARVGQLRRLCSELRDKLAFARDVQGRLAEALTQQAEAGNA